MNAETNAEMNTGSSANPNATGRHARGRLAVTIGLWIVFVGYALVLFKIVLFKYGLSGGLGSLNLVPFRFVAELMHPSTSFDVALKNVLGNFAIFIPLGVLAPALFSRVDRLWKAALIGLGVSAAFELVQGAFGLGAADIDDLLLNTLGAAVGALLYFFVFRRFGRRARLVALAFLCLFGLCGVVALWLYAPNELPAVVVTQNEAILGSLDPTSAALSRALERLDGETATFRISEASADTEYPLAPDARLYLMKLSYQYSPNGNIQKTFCTYEQATAETVQTLLDERGFLFADAWLDDAGAITSMILTVFFD